MQRLLEMISTAEIKGIWSGGEEAKAQRIPDPNVYRAFYEHLETCQPFVFHEIEPRAVDLLAREKTYIRGPIGGEEIDAPFPVFSVEALSGPLQILHGENGYRVEVFCIMTVELSPGEFIYWDYSHLISSTGERKSAVFASNAEGDAIKYIVQKLTREKMGLENRKVKVKLGSGQSKRFHQFRKIIHVHPKGSPSQGNGSREIDWSHRFEVRGHWVTLEPGENGQPRLGKNRDGDYCVPGHTWRKHHVRGPEHLPLVKKVRLVDQA